jgi:hypothetical protein
MITTGHIETRYHYTELPTRLPASSRQETQLNASRIFYPFQCVLDLHL